MNATISSSLKDLNISAVAALSAERGEPGWLLELRNTAFANFAALPWPDAKDERWKRSNPAAFDWSSISIAASRPQDRRFVELSSGFPGDAATPFAQAGVEWMPLEDAVRAHPDRIRDAWTSAVARSKSDKFRSLTLALANAGAVLVVEKGQALKSPVRITSSNGDGRSAYFPLNFFFIDQDAEAQVWEDLTGREQATTDPLFVSSCAVIDMKDNAKGSFYFLQRWDEATTHFQFQDVTQGAHSRFNAIAISLGGKLFRNETVVTLKGQGAENKVLGVLFGDASQSFENSISQIHEARKTTSDIQYRGALKGSSRSFFSGLVYIRKEAQQSDAFQSAKTLLLSKDAKADSIPNLEILADDVKCSHGAAVGPVDEEQKFYLQTRGVPPDEAEEIIVQGFFEPVIAEVPSESAQERLRTFVEAKLRQ